MIIKGFAVDITFLDQFTDTDFGKRFLVIFVLPGLLVICDRFPEVSHWWMV